MIHLCRGQSSGGSSGACHARSFRPRRRVDSLHLEVAFAVQIIAFCALVVCFGSAHAGTVSTKSLDPFPYDYAAGKGPPSRPLAETLHMMQRLHVAARGLSYESDRNFTTVVNSTFETYPMAGTAAFRAAFPNRTDGDAAAGEGGHDDQDDPRAQLSVRRIYQYVPGVGDVSMLVARVANPVGRFSILPPASGCGVGRNRTSETIAASAAAAKQGRKEGGAPTPVSCRFATNAGFFVTDADNPHCLGNLVSRGVGLGVLIARMTAYSLGGITCYGRGACNFLQICTHTCDRDRIRNCRPRYRLPESPMRTLVF